MGEPINPKAWHWFHETVGGGTCPIVDTWWQTETGGTLISPLPGCTPLKPGSATKPLPGIELQIVDAEGQNLGRLAATIAETLRGKRSPSYTPHVDCGDFVVVINADKVRVTGKKETEKKYMFFTGWVGREKYRTVAHFRKKRPEFLIMHAVEGMLPGNRIANKMLTKLKVYKGPNHDHQAQTPDVLKAAN